MYSDSPDRIVNIEKIGIFPNGRIFLIYDPIKDERNKNEYDGETPEKKYYVMQNYTGHLSTGIKRALLERKDGKPEADENLFHYANHFWRSLINLGLGEGGKISSLITLDEFRQTPMAAVSYGSRRNNIYSTVLDDPCFAIYLAALTGGDIRINENLLINNSDIKINPIPNPFDQSSSMKQQRQTTGNIVLTHSENYQFRSMNELDIKGDDVHYKSEENKIEEFDYNLIEKAGFLDQTDMYKLRFNPKDEKDITNFTQKIGIDDFFERMVFREWIEEDRVPEELDSEKLSENVEIMKEKNEFNFLESFLRRFRINIDTLYLDGKITDFSIKDNEEKKGDINKTNYLGDRSNKDNKKRYRTDYEISILGSGFLTLSKKIDDDEDMGEDIDWSLIYNEDNEDDDYEDDEDDDYEDEDHEREFFDYSKELNDEIDVCDSGEREEVFTTDGGYGLYLFLIQKHMKDLTEDRNKLFLRVRGKRPTEGMSKEDLRIIYEVERAVMGFHEDDAEDKRDEIHMKLMRYLTSEHGNTFRLGKDGRSKYQSPYHQ